MDPWRLARNRFRGMHNIDKVLEPLLASADGVPLLATLEAQQKLLDYVILDPLAQRFPPSAKFVAKLLKRIIDQFSAHYEVHESLLELYFEKSSTNPTEDGPMRNIVHKSWTIRTNQEEPEELVTVRMSEQLDSVGLTSWQAGFMIADFISANTELFEGKACLELGSGIGLAGIILSKLTSASKICLSDYTADVINNMRINLRINGLNDIHTAQLDWQQFANPDFDPTTLVPFEPDILIASDCAYDHELIEKLCLVFKWYLSRPTDRDKRYALVATTVRNPKTFQYFLTQLSTNQLVHEDITATSCFDNLFEQSHDGIILSRISYAI